ncbi:NlpC/P60 family protein [Leucobacter luti]|uniref:Cell wall-associated NlpC family hydrolase n=1 Tax=Leucobacter luti TaxID=340320 RepID=A0A4R6S733_9MICO|nr:NlpC/P60 family protein [Leucobacter luti]MCW2288763.1 cell wall-associated NlpC family hydrolase [Leucobacter luti]QYM75327.1 C40 family peptidase [Leucobacter luti]TCK45085.1 cell wall-associated NlpC family hydrolase [Leucobacter luti]TDP95610.1 cell wall-associated NlpC family hydrolase [Leucobacter luti]
MNQNPGTAVAVSNHAAKPGKSPAKRIGQMVGAAALSLGLVGTFGLPAYAVAPTVEGEPDAIAAAQKLETVEVDASVLPLVAPDGAVAADVLEAERKEKEEAAAAKAAKEAAELQAAAGIAGTAPIAPKGGADVPAGVGAQGLVAAALAQVGVSQDCTDLVQNSLAAIGLTTRRDQGGYDHGVSDFYKYGTPVTDGNYAPGDILIWPGAPHTAIYIGNGQAVHGGWGGNQTVVNTYASPSGTPDVVRLG